MYITHGLTDSLHGVGNYKNPNDLGDSSYEQHEEGSDMDDEDETVPWIFGTNAGIPS